jgi:hypothetical protein
LAFFHSTTRIAELYSREPNGRRSALSADISHALKAFINLLRLLRIDIEWFSMFNMPHGIAHNPLLIEKRKPSPLSAYIGSSDIRLAHPVGIVQLLGLP